MRKKVLKNILDFTNIGRFVWWRQHQSCARTIWMEDTILGMYVLWEIQHMKLQCVKTRILAEELGHNFAIPSHAFLQWRHSRGIWGLWIIHQSFAWLPTTILFKGQWIVIKAIWYCCSMSMKSFSNPFGRWELYQS